MKKWKIGIDVSMTVLLLALMSYALIGEAVHEWLGMGMVFLLVLHHVLISTVYRFANSYGGKVVMGFTSFTLSMQNRSPLSSMMTCGSTVPSTRWAAMTFTYCLRLLSFGIAVILIDSVKDFAFYYI